MLLFLAGAVALFARANDSPTGIQNNLSCSFDSDTAWLCLGEVHRLQLNTSGGSGPLTFIWQESGKPAAPGTAQSWYDFTPTAVGFDTLQVMVSDPVAGQCTSSIILATLGNCVWPGDANGNGIANHIDLLNIGRGMGLMGPARPDAHTNWIGQASHSWGQLAPDGADYTHADADGDGTIHLIDIQAIHQNYTFTPAATQPSSGSGPVFYLEFSDTTVSSGDTLYIDIMLGDAQHPVDSLYGLAFSLTFEDWLIDSGSVQLDLGGSWLGTEGLDMTGFARDFSQFGQIDIAMTRIDQVERNGYGRAAGIIVIIEDIVGKNSEDVAANIGIGGVQLESFDGRPRDVSVRSTPLSVGVEEKIHQDLGAIIFPNPAKSSINIRAPGTIIQQVSVFSPDGKKLLDHIPESRRANTQLTLPEAVSGYCFLTIQTNKGLIHRPLFITN
ncbi:MAG: T9SS type A sorting domain-containing protein [Bacteroidia bacterium]